jgi:acetyl-CoA carboxylase biotin carboxylase subunit
VEYLYDEASGRFYFIEMNTRIQVEHPVTEMITGIDLVREQIRIGLGADLGMTQAAVRRHGHALEVRLNAEDPARGFMPRPGRIDHLELPGGPGVRVDTMLFPGYTVPPYYDSLLAKLVVWGEDRGHALARLERALAELRIEGVPTTAGLHRDLAADPEVRAARFHSTWLEGWLAARQPR